MQLFKLLLNNPITTADAQSMTDLNLQSLAEMGAEIFSTIPVKGSVLLSTDEVSLKMAEYDAVIPY